MKPSTRLSSAVFHLTPTRTRCELIIIARDKKEKIASGLINPFLVHLKAAKDQFAKGGYSILLQPEHESDTAWFTKATLERFVRFVSTPEILERVYTVETEILQIEEAILIQSSNDRRHSRHDFGNNNVENLHEKSMGVNAGDRSISSCDEKAIVIYTPGPTLPESNGSYHHDEDPKKKLLKVLITRKSMIHKEQGMAFARAVAAGFELDNIEPLVSFAECFGAIRLKEACSRFVELWKNKQETGQWLDIEPSEALSNPPEFSMMNNSGIILSDTLLNHGESNVMQGCNGNSGPQNEAGESVIPNGHREFHRAHFSQLAYPPWPVHNLPVDQQAFQMYPVHGVPVYEPCANGHFFQPNPRHVDPFPLNLSPSEGAHKTNDINRTGASDDAASDSQFPHSLAPQNKHGTSRKKKSGTVVIRNINFVSSKRSSSGSETNSDSDAKDEYFEADGNHSVDGIQSYSGARRSIENSVNIESSLFRKDGENRQWQAFQDCLMRKSDDAEKDVMIQRQANTENDDAVTHITRDSGAIQDGRTRDTCRYNESTSLRPLGSSDEVLIQCAGNELIVRNDERNIRFSESSRRFLHRTTHEDSMIDGLIRNSYDPQCAIFSPNKNDRHRSSEIPDDFFVPYRSTLFAPDGEANRIAIDVDSEIPLDSVKMNTEREESKVNYEPNDLSWMPERGTESMSGEYNRTLDYKMQACEEPLNNNIDCAKGFINGSERERQSKGNSDSLHKKRTGGINTKGKIMKVSPPEDARARAEKLRSYKADLQRMKQEKEEAEKKRLEFLKRERQKRISAKGSVKPSTILPQVKHLSKHSPASSKGSKFSDLEPDSSSPIQRSKIRTSLPEEDNTTPDSKTSLFWIRRLSEPKPVSNPTSTATKARSGEAPFTRKSLKGPDKSKGERLHEMKTKGSKPSVNNDIEVAQQNADNSKKRVEKTVLPTTSISKSLPKLLSEESVVPEPVTSVKQDSVKKDQSNYEKVHARCCQEPKNVLKNLRFAYGKQNEPC